MRRHHGLHTEGDRAGAGGPRTAVRPTSRFRSPCPAPTGATAVAVGDEHDCALIAGGTVRCWGQNADGQLGSGNGHWSVDPVTVVGISTATEIAAVAGHGTCARLADATIKCWGMGAEAAPGAARRSRSADPSSRSRSSSPARARCPAAPSPARATTSTATWAPATSPPATSRSSSCRRRRLGLTDVRIAGRPAPRRPRRLRVGARGAGIPGHGGRPDQRSGRGDDHERVALRQLALHGALRPGSRRGLRAGVDDVRRVPGSGCELQLSRTRSTRRRRGRGRRRRRLASGPVRSTIVLAGSGLSGLLVMPAGGDVP